MIKNFYKKIGNLFINQRNVIILFCVNSLIIFLFISVLSKKFNKLNTYQYKLKNLENISLNSLDNRKEIKHFIEKHSNVDKFFIDNNLENLKFLEKEKNILNSLFKHSAFKNNSILKSRLDFIQSDQNTLKFAEENLQQNSLIKENDENQLFSIEIDENDLQKILSIVEFSEKNISQSPQLIIKNFILNKSKENTFLLEMKILKREFLQKVK